jgi:hypothetical protein
MEMGSRARWTGGVAALSATGYSTGYGERYISWQRGAAVDREPPQVETRQGQRWACCCGVCFCTVLTHRCGLSSQSRGGLSLLQAALASESYGVDFHRRAESKCDRFNLRVGWQRLLLEIVAARVAVGGGKTSDMNLQ